MKKEVDLIKKLKLSAHMIKMLKRCEQFEDKKIAYTICTDGFSRLCFLFDRYLLKFGSINNKFSYKLTSLGRKALNQINNEIK